LSTGTQVVQILPYTITKVSYLSTSPPLVAGTTSQTFTFATVDNYNNPSPLAAPDMDPGLQTAAFPITSNSSGTLQFASPAAPPSFTPGSGTALLRVGQSSGPFVMIDTPAGRHGATVS